MYLCFDPVLQGNLALLLFQGSENNLVARLCILGGIWAFAADQLLHLKNML